MIPNNRIDGLGKRIKGLREANGYRQEDLARLTDIGRSSIGAYEIGSESPTYANLIRIAQVLNVSTDYLLGYENEDYLDLSGIDEKKRESIYELYNMLMASA